MQKQITYKEAWDDFFLWIKDQDIWKDREQMPRSVKQYIDRANRHSRAGHLGRERARGIIEKYAPGRYKFLDIVELNGELAEGKSKPPTQ